MKDLKDELIEKYDTLVRISAEFLKIIRSNIEAYNILIRSEEIAIPFVKKALEFDAIAAEIIALEDQIKKQAGIAGIIQKHKCKLIARACMGEGRDWWCGELTETIKEYPLETHCLHLKTQFKDVIFLCNKADFQQLQLLGRSITGKLDETWIESMLKVIKRKDE